MSHPPLTNEDIDKLAMKVDRIKETLGILIGWLYRELGQDGIKSLLTLLDGEKP
jgi:hypothetical protein